MSKFKVCNVAMLNVHMNKFFILLLGSWPLLLR